MVPCPGDHLSHPRALRTSPSSRWWSASCPCGVPAPNRPMVRRRG